MIIYKIFIIFLIIKTNHAEFVQFRPFNPSALPQLPKCPPAITNLTTATDKPNENMKFLLPFMDIELQYDRNIHVMQEVVQQHIFVLHGHKLYQLFVSRQERRLSLMGYLKGSVQLNHWELRLSIGNQLSQEVLKMRADIAKDPRRGHEPAPTFEAIQQLTLTGKYQKLFLFTPTEKRVMIVAAVNFTKLYGKFRTFEWLKTYFDPVEEFTVPTIHVVNVVGTQAKYLIAGRTIKHQAKTILTVYEITPPTLQFRVKQTLTVQSHVVHIINYRNRNLIVACSSKQRKCNSFRQMSDGNFNVYKQRTPKELAFDLLSSSSRFIMASRQNQIMIFTNYRLDCYGSFLSDQMDVSKLMGHHNEAKEDYVVIIYKRPFKVLIRVIELELNLKEVANITEPEDMLASTHHQHLFESVIGRLRSLLLQRKIDMDVLRKVTTVLTPKMSELKTKEAITVQSGNVGIVRVMGKYLKSPKQILDKIENIRQKYLSQQRSKRSQTSETLNITLEITNRIKVNKIKVKNLIFPGDLIQGFYLNESAKPWPILTIKPKVKTHTLNTTELIRPENKRGIRQYIPELYFDFIPILKVNHLKVDSVNGIPWQEFYESIFLKNRDSTIQGRLVLQSQVDVIHLNTTLLNGLIAAHLFNLRDPQIVHSNLVISRLFVKDLKAEKINGLKFEEDIVYSGQDTFVASPVKMYHLSISGDILLANNNKFERFSTDPDDMEFKQIYTNKVVINGSLIVNNIKRESNKTKIIIGEMEFEEQEIKEKYLLKQEPQNFTFPIIFNNAKVSAPYLETKYLNDHLTQQHMMVNNNINSTRPMLLVFMNAHVKGNLKCRDYKSKIVEIKENLIHPGDSVNITGKKIFEAPLIVDDLNAEFFNKLPVDDLVFKTQLENSKFQDPKIFNKIEVKNPVIVDNELQASYLNNLPLEDLLNYDYYMQRLNVPHTLETSNIVFHKINGIPFDEFFKKINIKNEQLILHKDLIVEGNILFAEPLELKQINDINWNDYVANLVRIHEDAELKGDVYFYEDLTITKDFDGSDINGYDLEDILKNTLMKSKPQFITGSYTFDNLNVSNLDVLSINNVKVKEFIDLSKNHTEIKGDIIVENLIINRDLKGILDNCIKFKNLTQQLQVLVSKPWKNLMVLNNVKWPKSINDNTQGELLKYLYKNSVKSNQNQVITGNVKFSKPLIRKMQTRLQFPTDIDINFISRDGLLKNSSILQIIKGRKEFLKPLYVESLKVQVLNTRLINNIDILRFNDSLYRLSSKTPLLGPLKFLKPLSVGHLTVLGLINGLNTSLIYQIDQNSALPALTAHELYIDNEVNIKNINDMSVEYFLDNRITLQGPALEQFGTLTFEHLIIQKEALLQNINNIHIDNLIFKHSPYLQTITGHKTIQKSLELAGPAHILRINNKDLMELYRNSLLSEHNYQFDNLQIDKATFERGLQVVRNLNSNFKQRSFSDIETSTQEKRQEFKEFLKDIKQTIEKNQKQILYLDYDLNSIIKWENPKNANINQTTFYEISRVSYFEKYYLKISFNSQLQEIYLQNITSNRLSMISNKISIKVENYCKFKYRKVKSKITIIKNKLLKVFGMKRYIENIYTLKQTDNNQNYVLLHALDLPSLKRNEVRIFKIDDNNNTIQDWQDLTQNIGEKLKLYEFESLTTIITNGIIDNHPGLTIYHFNTTTKLFKLQQIIDGDYDIIEMVELSSTPSQKQMIISCCKCHRIFIYDYTLQTLPNYQIFQIITLKSLIDKLVIFYFENNQYMLVVSHKDSNFYNIYKYSHIQGWLHLTYGYFPNLQMSVPLSQLSGKDNNFVISHNSNGIPLLLLCNLDNCYLIKAIV